MKVFIEKDNKLLELQKAFTASELLKELRINPSTVIIVKNDEVALEDEQLDIDDEIKILSVISGG